MDPDQPANVQSLKNARAELLNKISARQIASDAVLQAMTQVPREAFIAPELRDHAYDDNALPIGDGQTISQPSVVAIMSTALNVQPSSSVLEIGTGSGYQAAILSQLATSVVTVERYANLAERAAATLMNLGYNNVAVHTSDGSTGWAAGAPYDRILVTAAAPSVPAALLEQLRDAEGSCLVVPVGDQTLQQLLVTERVAGQWVERHVGQVRFVPLRGHLGWSSTDWADSTSEPKIS